MSDEALHELAGRAGLTTVWHDVFGSEQHVAPATLRAVLAAIGLPGATEAECRDSIAVLDAEAAHPPRLATADRGAAVECAGAPGRFRVEFEQGGSVEGIAADAGFGRVRLPAIETPGAHRLLLGDAEIDLIVAPDTALPIAEAALRAHHERSGGTGPAAEATRLWGLAAQVYGLVRKGDGGVGDFEALAQLAESASRHGADAVAISPVHALFAAEPRHYGPYAPSSRIALNPVYAPVELSDVPLPPDGLIDWPEATRRRYAALRAEFAVRRNDPDFIAFLRDAPSALRRHAVFEAISLDRIARGEDRDWRRWPAELRDPDGDAVRRLAETLDDEVTFHLYAQFRAASGLAEAQRRARDAGMAIGLIADLAVGADPAGSDAWSRPNEVLRGLSVGAPPDEFNHKGQNWGVTAFSPRGLVASGFAAFRDLLGAAFGPAGGVRIDHAMGFARLWVVPNGAEASEGCYLRFPLNDMLRILAHDSRHHGGIVLAEDLGTVPAGFRDHLAARQILGMSILWFERRNGGFAPPRDWRRETAAMTSTHGLPTVAGWWRGTDIDWRERLGMSGEDNVARDAGRGALWQVFRDSGAVDAGAPQPPPEAGATVADAAARHLGTASGPLAILPVEDALALTEQPNLPGTIDTHPNWRRRVPGEASDILDAPDVAVRLAGLDKARRR